MLRGWDQQHRDFRLGGDRGDGKLTHLSVGSRVGEWDLRWEEVLM